MKRYGFIGLGIMGSAMANNLVEAGFNVTVWNRGSEKCDPLVAAGAKESESAAQAVAASDITFAMLSDPAVAKAVCFGAGGVLEGMATGKGYVDMSTVDPATSRLIADAVAERGGRFLEAPVSGSKKPAEDGTLVILSAGDGTLYEDALPAFEVMGKKTFYLGDVGKGAEMKLIVNMIMGGMMALFSEGLALGEKVGLSCEEILNVLDSGAITNPMFRLKGPSMAAGAFTTAFPLKHMQKDLRLAVSLGDEHDQALFTVSSVNESFKKARALGFSNEDFSAVLKAIRG
jgi:2-hydroxy-3-oxopropionate reductase